MNLKAITLLSACLGLAACGGSSSSGSGNSSPSFDSMAKQGRNLLAKYENSDITSTSAMPTGGKATYNGVAAYSDVPDLDYITSNAEVMSTVRMDANFDSNTISGQLANFRGYDNSKIPGSVSIRNGTINGNGIRANLSGNLTVEGRNAGVDGDLEAVFVGPKANAVIGVVAGTVGNEDIYGVIGAEK